MDGQSLLLELLPNAEDDLLHDFVPQIAQALLRHRQLQALLAARLRSHRLVAEAITYPLQRVDIQWLKHIR